jgi:hypothetical protein
LVYLDRWACCPVLSCQSKKKPIFALLLASVTLGIITGMDIRDVADAVQTGVGITLGNVDRSFGEDSTWNDGLISLENQSLRLMVSLFTLGCARGFNKGEQNQFMSAASII